MVYHLLILFSLSCQQFDMQMLLFFILLLPLLFFIPFFYSYNKVFLFFLLSSFHLFLLFCYNFRIWNLVTFPFECHREIFLYILCDFFCYVIIFSLSNSLIFIIPFASYDETLFKICFFFLNKCLDYCPPHPFITDDISTFFMCIALKTNRKYMCCLHKLPNRFIQ